MELVFTRQALASGITQLTVKFSKKFLFTMFRNLLFYSYKTGSCTVRWENKTMYCIVSVFGLSI